MTESIQIVYVTDWLIENHGESAQDPFYDILQTLDAKLFVCNEAPESFDDVDLLILHPVQMSAAIFDIISDSKVKNPAIKTVVISSAHGSDLFLHAIDVGVDKYLLKPLSGSAVKKVAERLIQHSIEAKQAQKAFKQINLMFGAISKTSLLVRTERNGMIIEVNNLLAKLLGYASSEMIDSHWMRFVERRFWVYLQTLVQEKIKAGEIYRGVIELLASSGDPITVDATIYAIRDDSGEIEEIVFIGDDQTEVNKAILTSMEQLIDHDTSLAVLFDDRHNAVLVNQKFLALKGYTSSQPFFDSYDTCTWMVEEDGEMSPVLGKEGSQKEALEAIFEMMQEGKIHGHKIVAMDKNLNKCHFTIHTTSMLNPMIRNEEYHILYFVDVTDLERSNEERLNDAKLMSVGRLAAAITHEINTPITYIKGNLELLKLECEGTIPDAVSMLHPIEEGVARIESIVRSMYEFTGTGKEEMKPCNVHMTLVYSLRIIMNRAKHIVPITINGDVFTNNTAYDAASTCVTMGISTRLEQVWIIILNNALDEFEKGKIAYDKRRLDIFFYCDSENITVKIVDNAGGIPEEIVRKIFDFATGGEKKKSMGIGLNVAKTIIDKHGGAIHASNEDNGAVFEIMLKTYKEEK